MSARDEITHLMNRYCFAVDTGDIDGFAGLFEHGACRRRRPFLYPGSV